MNNLSIVSLNYYTSQPWTVICKSWRILSTKVRGEWRSKSSASIYSIIVEWSQNWTSDCWGGVTGGLGGTFPHSSQRLIVFVNRLKPMRRFRGIGRWRHQPYLNFNLSLSQLVFKDRI